jgi:hypothetical protein
MPALTRRISAMILLAFTIACPAPAPRVSAADAPAEIHLGKQAVPAPKADPAAMRAVDRFFAARQSASLDRTRLAAARRLITSAVRADDASLAGAPGQTLVAFDFTEGAIERLASGRFRVSVYLLFADRQGRVVESRDETLVFTGQEASYSCASLKTTNVMHWDSDEVVKGATRLKASQALDRANESLQEWTRQQNRLAAYSIEDVFPAGTGRIMIPCLKFTAEPGKRGYDVVDSPIMIRRGPRGYQIESPAN